MVLGSSPEHRSSQVESALQLTEHDPVHVTVHVEPPPQFTLPLSPTVTSQVDPPPQSMLHEAPHSPVHSLSALQSRLQLSPSHSLPPRSHASPAGQAQVVPVHSGGGTSSSELPQPERRPRETTKESVVREARRMSGHSCTPGAMDR